jgi:hypothetical protein
LELLSFEADSVLAVESLADVPDAEPVDEALGGAYVSRVVNALCAPEILSLDSAVETLERNWPSGELESAFEGLSFSTTAKYDLASVVSPDLMEDIKPESALSKELLLLEELETDDVEDAASSVRRELLLCKLEINIEFDLCRKFLRASATAPRYACGPRRQRR